MRKGFRKFTKHSIRQSNQSFCGTFQIGMFVFAITKCMDSFVFDIGQHCYFLFQVAEKGCQIPWIFYEAYGISNSR